MQRGALPGWASDFADCVAVLGQAIFNLRTQLDARIQKADQARSRAAVRAVTAAAHKLRDEHAALRHVTIDSIRGAHGAIDALVRNAASDLARRRAATGRWRKLALGALLSVCRQRSIAINDLNRFDTVVAPPPDGTGRATNLDVVAELICAAAQRRVGSCLDVSLFIQVPGNTTMFLPPRLYRLLPPSGHHSTVEALAVDSVVLGAPAYEVPLDSLAGYAVEDGQTIHVPRRAWEHPNYEAEADRSPHCPAPRALLYVPVPSRGVDQEGFAAVLRLGRGFADRPVVGRTAFSRSDIEAVQAAAPAFALALRGCFGAAAEERSKLLDAVLSTVGTRALTPCLGADVSMDGVMAALRSVIANCTTDACALLHASTARLWLHAAASSALYTLSDDAVDLEVPAQVSLALDSPTSITLLGKGSEAYAATAESGEAKQIDAVDADTLSHVTIWLDPTSEHVRPRSVLAAAAIAVHAAATGDGMTINVPNSHTHYLTRPPVQGADAVPLLAAPVFSATSGGLLAVLEVVGKCDSGSEPGTSSAFSGNDAAALEARLRVAALELEHYMLKAASPAAMRS